MAKQQAHEAIKRVNERLGPIRRRVIAAGRATPETVDSVIYSMDVDDFLRFRGECPDVSRVDFKPEFLKP